VPARASAGDQPSHDDQHHEKPKLLRLVDQRECGLVRKHGFVDERRLGLRQGRAQQHINTKNLLLIS